MDLAQAVLLVQRAHCGFRTACGTVSWWANGGVREAIRRARPDIADQNRVPEGPEQWGSPEPHLDDFWAEAPGRFRLERRIPNPPRLPHLAIVNGPQWWTYDPASGAETNLGDPTAHLWLGSAPELLDPAELLGCLDLRMGGDDEVVGRPVLRLQGEQRQSIRRPGRGVRLMPHTLVASYADRYDVYFDAETGVCLRATSILDDRPIMVVEVVSLEFDQHVPSDMFTFEAPEGVEIRPAPRAERAAGCRTQP